MKVTFLGGGNMGAAIVGGLVAKGFPAADITVIEPGAPALDVEQHRRNPFGRREAHPQSDGEHQGCEDRDDGECESLHEGRLISSAAVSRRLRAPRLCGPHRPRGAGTYI